MINYRMKVVRDRTSNMRYLRNHWILYVMLVFPVLFYFLFHYLPIPGLAIAFKDYNMFKGIWNSEWVGLRYFRQAFGFELFWVAVRNTMVLNVIGLVLGFPAPILLALLLNELRNKHFKKITQTVLYLPHFISWVIVGGMMYQLFASSGFINTVIKKLGGSPVPFLSNSGWWIFTYFIVGQWKNIGWNTIIYLSAMTGVDSELYEAARVDGCSRFRMMFSITLPCIMDTVMILLILSIGSLASIGFEQPYVMQNSVVMDVADVISTYVYRVGLQQAKLSIGSAIGLSQSLINFVLVISANMISKRLTDKGIW
jgi:putative aldouronate transport system permease protein